ncbi:MAG: hypothetical protein AAGK78_00315 [Planctomycetota bacterium]
MNTTATLAADAVSPASLTAADRLRRKRMRWSSSDPMRDAAAAGTLDWSSFRETGGTVRQQLQFRDTSVLVRMLALAGFLCFVRGLVVPMVLQPIVEAGPPHLSGEFATFLDPVLGTAAIILSAILIGLALIGRRFALTAGFLSVLAFGTMSMAGFAAREPDLWALLSFAFVGLIVLRGALAGLQHHMR